MISEIRDAMRDACTHLLRSLPAGPRSWARATLGKFIQIDLRIPDLGRLHEFVPDDLAACVCRGACHHAGKSGFGALGRLVMKTAAGNALDERFLLFRIGELQIGGKAPRD